MRTRGIEVGHDRLLRFLAKLLQQRSQKTLTELAQENDCSRATMHRWIVMLERHFPDLIQYDLNSLKRSGRGSAPGIVSVRMFARG